MLNISVGLPTCTTGSPMPSHSSAASSPPAISAVFNELFLQCFSSYSCILIQPFLQQTLIPPSAAALLLLLLQLLLQLSSPYSCRPHEFACPTKAGLRSTNPTLTCAPAASFPPAASAVLPGVPRGGAAPLQPGQRQLPPPTQPAAANAYNTAETV